MDKLNFYLEKLVHNKDKIPEIEAEINMNVFREKDLSLLNRIIKVMRENNGLREIKTNSSIPEI
jgi:hypothetical protein